MRSVWGMVAVATLFVIGGFYLFRGETRDQHQDQRTTQIADDTRKLADTTATIARNTKAIGDDVNDLRGDVEQADDRIGKLESNAAELDKRVKAVEDFIPTREEAIAYNFIGGDFAVGSMAKTSIAEALMSNGVAPGSNAEAGLPVPTDLRGQSLRATYVRSGAQIVLEYDEKSGVDGGVITLTPDVELAMRSGVFNWRCETHDFVAIEKFVPSCKYIAR